MRIYFEYQSNNRRSYKESKACKKMGLSRDAFYRYKAAADEGGVQALFDRNRRSSNIKNRVDPLLEDIVLK